MVSTKKQRASFFSRHRVAIIVIVGVTGLGIAYFLLIADFRNHDRVLRERALSVFNKVEVPTVLQLQKKEYVGNHMWGDYNPEWVFYYNLTADKKTVYEELEKALIKACGPNTPEDPYSVHREESPDPEKYGILGAQNCEEVDIIYERIDDMHATITARPN
jgi:hypothetical protein